MLSFNSSIKKDGEILMSQSGGPGSPHIDWFRSHHTRSRLLSCTVCTSLHVFEGMFNYPSISYDYVHDVVLFQTFMIQRGSD
uniref:Uncharacterized protein n=1 Tax=Anguilla anguilla TaxID=7936 RepID=A0A0E9RMF6_ANGAN